MADIVRRQPEGVPGAMFSRYRDMNDTTHALVVSASMAAQVEGGQYANVIIDPLSGALIEIDFAHHELHEGDHFSYTNAEDIGNSATVSFTLTTPNTTKWSHLGFNVSAEAEFDLQIFEGATGLTSSGTVVSNPAVINDNRNSTNANTMIIRSGPTLGGGSKGTLIKRFHGGSGKLTGGTAGTGEELILKQNTIYWIDLLNSTTSNNFIGWIVEWYEHTSSY